MVKSVWSNGVVGPSQHPISQNDVLSGLAQYIGEYAGWMEVSVVLEDGILTVDCDSSSSSYRLIYDVKNRRETNGRLKSLGITLPILETIHSLETKLG